MSMTTSAANCARLDDCHSTVFYLADLSGIKWRKFSSNAIGFNADPVLAAFTKCLAQDILAVWRRSPKATQTSGIFEKELWIFWWGEEPHVNEIAQHQGLKDEAAGCWEEGLTYECRTLLFKAIHNLVERCLLHENFVRIGQWFVKPFIKDAEEDISDRLSFSFSFFLHGESSVCTTVEIARHRDLERLTIHHIQQVNASLMPNSVILAPYGLEAKLSGVFYRLHEPNVKKLLEEWKPFYPLGIAEDFLLDDGIVGDDDLALVPPVVEVILGGIHMNYPSHFVLLPYCDLPATQPMMKTPHSPPRVTHIDNARLASRPASAAPTSVQSASELPPHHHVPTFQWKNPNTSNDAPYLDEEEASSKSSYFIDRMRSSSLHSAQTPQKNETKVNSPAPSSVATVIKHELPDVKPSSDELEKTLASTPSNPATQWSFADPLRAVRCNNNIKDDPDVITNEFIKNIESQHRLRSYSSFHQRCTDDIAAESKKEHYTIFATPLSEPMSVPAPECTDMPLLDPTFSGVIPNPDAMPHHPIFHQVPQGRMFPTAPPMNGDSLDKMGQRPFVTLGNMLDTWTEEEKAEVTAQYEESSIEVQRMVVEWRGYRIPPQLSRHSLKRPSIRHDGLDPPHTAMHYINTLMFKSRPIPKKMKMDASVNVDPMVVSLPQPSSSMMEIVKLEQNRSTPFESEQITLGGANGELAGMLVPSDPYAFEEMDDTLNQRSAFSDISLKKSVQVSPWPSSTQSIPPSIETKNIKIESGVVSTRTELETLLLQNSPDSRQTSEPISGSTLLTYSPSRHNTALINKSIKSFCMDDINEAMLDNEENGVPTPPNDPNDSIRHDTTTFIHERFAPPAPYAPADIQQMFPTPPSLEQCQPFSPEGRNELVTNPTSSISMADPIPPSEQLFSLHYKRTVEGERTDVTSSLLSSQTISLVPSHTVEGTTSLESHQPLPPIYNPLCLGQLSNHTSYVPSWQVPANVPMSSFLFAPDVPNYPFTPPAPNMSAGVFTPCTPGQSSVRTPGSVQQQNSVPTPSHNPSIDSLRSCSPAVVKRVYVDQHGSAALFTNLLLSDSIMNLFWDKSFDQCALCACNADINGSDVDLGYLPGIARQESQFRCSCGFSAVRNRMASVGSGLFLEDEFEIIGSKYESMVMHNRKLGTSSAVLDDDIILLVLEHCTSPFVMSQITAAHLCDEPKQLATHNTVCLRDECETFVQALTWALSDDPTIKVDAASLDSPIHPWKTVQFDELVGASTLDIYRLLVSLKPVLQDSIQRKRTTRSFGTTQHVKGPLTWRDFCKEAGKNAEPQPIPTLVVGYDQDWLTVSPVALKYWEKLFLEPYSAHRDMVYVALCPDVDYIVSAAKLFFKELSSLFESYRLGRLKPYNRAFKESGIVRVRAECAGDVTSGMKLNKSEGSRLMAIADACTHAIGPALKLESSLDLPSLYIRELRLRPPSTSVNQVVASERPPQMGLPQNALMKSLPASVQTGHTPKLNDMKEMRLLVPSEYDPTTASTIVIYLLDPFQGSMAQKLWKCFMDLQKSLPKPVKDHVILQIVPLERVVQMMSSNGSESLVHMLRALSFSMFAQPRKIPPFQTSIRSMTGFGPKAASKNPSAEQVTASCLYTPPYVLSLPHERNTNPLAMKSDSDCNILYVCYCLSHDQSWLISAATDQRGERIESCCINIAVPPRRLSMARKHRASVRGEAIQKLWHFCVTTLSHLSAKSWRIVIGRMGRLSHGEIRDWSKYLNRKSLLSSSKRLSCQQCKVKQNCESPIITSACLTSLEPDGSMRILSDVVRSNNFGRSNSINQTSQLKTPDDISCTHIYVFPTSADTQVPGANQAGVEEDSFGQTDVDTGILPAEVFKDLVSEDDLLMDFGTLMGPSSLSMVDDDPIRTQPSTERLLSTDVGASDDSSLLQQPLALGYLVSTAPPGPLPAWFWSTCPQAYNRCPVLLRSALHIQTNVSDASTDRNQHPLDSNKTATVLRFVLENYNALSWLTCDPVSRDRRSCLPVHYLSLVQLYHAIRNLMP